MPGGRIRLDPVKRSLLVQSLAGLEAQSGACYVSSPPRLYLDLTTISGGRGNVIPGAIMFAIFGAAGQALYNMADARNSELTEIGESEKKTSFLNSKWSPMKVLSDNEYEKMLREKLLRVNAQIALVDENIEALRAQERELATEEKKLSDRKDPTSK